MENTPKAGNNMKLYIDTSNSDKVILEMNNKKFETDSKKQKAQTLLPFIAEILAKEEGQLNELSEIEVHTGPGSFTGLRVGVAVANALGWSLKIPVNGKIVSSNEALLNINY